MSDVRSNETVFDPETWPRDLLSGRFWCHPEHPMPKGAPGQWSHTGVVDDGECYEGCCDDYKCTDCGHRWRVECAQ